MERKSFLLRLDPATMSALRAWAGDDLRSLNGQIEFLLRRALREAGRLPSPAGGRKMRTRPAVDDGGASDTDDPVDGDAAAAAVQTSSDRSEQED